MESQNHTYSLSSEEGEVFDSLTSSERLQWFEQWEQLQEIRRCGWHKLGSEAEATIPRLSWTRQEVARALGCSVDSVDDLRRRGLLRPSEALRKPMYPIEEVHRFLRDTMAEG